MKRLVTFIVGVLLPVLAAAQGTCPSMFNRNNGNGGASSCPGVGTSAQATDVVGTAYQFSSCCNTLTKEGDFQLKWTSGVGAPSYVPAVKKVYVNGALATVVMGPPSPFSSSGGDTIVDFCFYTTNVANGNVLTVFFVNPLNDTAFATCNYAWSSGNTTITPNAAPTISTQPASQTACTGASVTFSVTAAPGTTGNTLSYQWSKNNINITGATNSTYTINPIAITDSGYYLVTITESNGAITSSTNAQLTTKSAPSLTSATNSGPACVGNTLTLTASGGTNVTSYAWSGPVSITSSTSAIATVPSASTTATGTYSVTVTNGSGTGCSVVYTTSATVSSYPTVSAIGGNTTLSTAITTTLTDATGSGTWASATSTVATVGTSGVVSPVATGTELISYTVTNSGCGTTVTTNVTVNSPNNGLNFDGSNDYVITPNLFSSIGTSSVTVEVWFKATAAGVIVDERGSPGVSSGWDDSWMEILSTGQVKVRLWNLTPVSLGTVSFGTWHHAVLRYDGSTHKLDGLLDGVASAGSTTGSRSTTTATYLVFGYPDATNMGSGAYFKGTIDEVRIWKTALTNSQVQSNMNCDVAQDPNLIAYYRFDQGTAGGSNTTLTTAADYSGNNNCATLNNFALSGSTSNYVVGAIGSCNAISISLPGTTTGTASVCTGSSTTLTNGVSGGTWSTSSGNVTLSGTATSTVTVNGITAGTANITYSLNCGIAVTTVTINAAPTPTFTSSAAANICTGTSVTYTTQSGQSNYSWSVPGTGGGVDYTITSGGTSSTDNTVTLTWISGGSKTVTVDYTSASGCASTGAVSSTTSVNATPPTVASITGTTTVSSGGTTALSDATGGGTWSSSNTSVGTVDASGNVTGLTSGTTTISYTVTSGGCSTSATINVSVTGFNAVNLDGTNDYIDIGNLLSSNQSYTKEAWIFANATGSNNIISSNSTPFWITGGHLSAANNYPTGGVTVSDPGTFTTGVWTHVAVTYDASTNTMNLYKNGTLVATNTSAPGYSSGTIQVGAWNTGNFFNGTIDEVRIWNRALCSGEINNDLTGELPGGQTGLVAYYKFDQGIASGTNTGLTTATDASGNGNNGTLNNFALTGGTSNWVAGHVTGTASSFSAPTISAGSNVTICSVSSTTLTATGGSSYTWSPSTGLSSTAGSSVTASPTVTTTYTATDACGGTAAVQVSVNPLPTVAAITGNTTLSTAITTTLSDATGGGTWASGTTGTATVNSSGVVSGVAGGTALISYTVTSSGCSTTVTTNVTVKSPTNGLSFDGVDDYIDLSLPAVNDFTLEYWVRNDGTDAGFDRITSTAGDAFETAKDGSGNLSFFTGSGWTTFTNIGTNTWAHLAYVRSGTTLSIYQNGALVNTYTVPSTALPGTWYFGQRVNTGGEFGHMTLDEVRLWNVARTQTQIQNSMNCDVAQTGNLVAYYRFDQGTGNGTNTGLTCVDDYSGNGHTGTLNNAALTGTSSNYVTGAVGDCNTITLTTPGSFSGNSPVCAGSSITLSNANTGGTWTTASSNITLNSTSGLVTGVTAGTATVNYTLNCSTSSVTSTVNALPTPSFTSAPSASTCAGTSVTYTTQTGGSNYTWSVPGTGSGVDYTITAGGTGTSSNTVTLKWVTTTTKTVTVNYTDANGCTGAAAASNTTTVNALPTISGGSSTSVCTGSSTALAASGGISYTWSPSTGLSATTGSGVTASPTVTTTYTVTGTDANSCTNTGTVTVTVNALPTYSAAGAAICNGASTPVTVNAPATGNALTFPGSGNNYVSIPNTAANRLSSTNFTVSAWIKTSSTSLQNILFHGLGCSTWASWYLGIGGAESATFPGKIVFGFRTSGGSGGNEVAAPSTVTTGTWTQVTATYDGSNLRLYLNGSLAATAAASGTAYAVTDGLYIGMDPGCGGRNPFNGAIDELTLWNSTLSASTIASIYNEHIAASTSGIVGSYAFDEASGTTIQDSSSQANNGTITGSPTRQIPSTAPLVNAATGSSFVWSPATSLSASTGSTVTASPTSNTTYTITGTNSNGCVNSTTATVTVNALPTPTFTAQPGANTCASGSVTYTTQSGQSNYTWSVPGTGGGVDYTITSGGIGTSSNTVTLTWLTAGSKTVTVNYTNSNGCTGSSAASNTTTVNARPMPSFTAAPSANSCLNSNVTYTTQAGQSSYVWTLPGTSGVNYSIVSGGSSSDNSVTLAWLTTGTKTVTVNYTDANGCTGASAASNTTTVNSLPVVSGLSVTGSTVCAGSASTISVTSSLANGNYTFNYTLGAPNAGSGSATASTTSGSGTFNTTTLANAGASSITINSVTDNTTGCSSNPTASTTLTVNPNPVVSGLTVNGFAVCAGFASTVTLGGSLTNGTYTVNYSLGAPNSGTYSTSVTTTGGTGTFSTPVLANVGTTSITINSVVNPTTGCSSATTATNNIVVSSNPTAYNVTGGGTACAGGSGFAVTLSNSTTGIYYQLYNSGTPVGSPIPGTGSPLSLGTFTASGTFTVIGRNVSTTCTSYMSGSAVVVINPNPAIVAMTGGGSYCSGGTGVNVGLAGSAVGINYQLYRGATAVGSPVAGIGVLFNFGLETVAGTYTAVATNATTGCTSNMSGSSTVSIDPLPTVYSVTGGGGYCSGGSGVTIGLSGSDAGVSYQLYNSGSPVVGTIIAGTGSAISFGVQSVAGTYTVVATNNTTSCTNTMSGSVSVAVNPLPTVYTMTGGGSYCTGGAGVTVGLSNSDAGINYQLYISGVAAGSPVAGTGSALSFGLQTSAGTYTVVASDATTSCTSNMSGSAAITINPLPSIYTVTGGGSYCSGGTGVAVGLSSSQSSVNYQLYNGASAVGSPVAGTGSAISFGSLTAAGSYTVTATSALSSCTSNMTGSVTISINANPTTYSVTGGGSYCVGGTGVSAGLANSQSGISYQLYNGSTATGSPVSGSGLPISFGLQTAAGTYTIVATNTTTSCTNNMTGSATVSIDPLPTVLTMTGGGAYCSGGTGVSVGLSSSVAGVNYQLYNGASAAGSPAAGTGSAISFGVQTTAGTYTAIATDATTGCTSNMSGSALVTVNSNPTVYTVTGGGSFCSGGVGVNVGLSNSQTGVNYQLYNGASAVGSPVGGTGIALAYGLQTAAGTYTVAAVDATTGCSANMTGSATVVVNANPTVYAITGGGTYCTGTSGVAIGLASSDAGVNYQLYLAGSATGSPVAGTGSAISFGLQTTSGTYTAGAVNATTGCSAAMSGSTSISISPLPAAIPVVGGGSICSGGGLTVDLAGSAIGVNYQLYRGATAVGSPVAGVGYGISFGLQTVSGVYTVIGTNTTTGCSNTMSGSVTVAINPLPTVYTVTGGGAYCSGGAGASIGLAGSDAGVSYQLYTSGSATGSPVAGTGSALSLGSVTGVGTYSVVATNTTTGCTANMSGSATVSTIASPAAFTVTGGGGYCTGGTGVTVGLSGSQTGATYQLYNGASMAGSALAGTGSSLSFGLQTTGGTYTVVATNTSTLCTANMSGSATIAVNPLPTAYAVTGGGSYCAGGTGVHVGLSNSTIGVNYQLYAGSTTAGSPVAGTGTALDLGLQTAVATYTVTATDATTGCSNNMTGSAAVSTIAGPTVYSVTGGGGFCTGGTGATVGISSSQTGVNYQLYNGASTVGSPVAGSGSAISFGLQTTPGTYTVVATNTSTSCTTTMSGSVLVTINPPPTAYAMTGGGVFCSGGSGAAIGLAGSDAGVNYQLYKTVTGIGTTAVGSAVAGTGAAINFGTFTAAGTYTVTATNATTGCTNGMTGSAVITINTPPAIVSVTGGGSYCSGGTGVAIGLAASAVGVNYQLYRGATAVGSPVAGIGTALSFGLQTVTGTYTVIATNATTLCTSTMSGSASVSIYPALTSYAMTGGGSYCSGGTGVAVGLSGSDAGVNYQLYLGGSPLAGTTLAGTGGALNFGSQTTAGSYTVVATNATTGCTASMTGTSNVSINTLPSAYTVTGSGSYCSGGAGVAVGLGFSDIGVNYQLYRGTTAVGSSVAGTGSALNFGLQTTAGTYTVAATNSTTGCSNNMTGSATISINALPTVFTVSGGGAYCSGGSGVHVMLGGSSSGINYQLYNGASAVGSPLAGTGATLDFGPQTTAGTYTVVATNATTSCVSNMSGSATVSINALPAAFTVTGGGSYCSGGSGVAIGLGNSATGINYQLYRGGTLVGSAVAGTGSAISFGNQATAGTYTVTAANATTGCANNMTGSATVSVNSLPTAFAVTGGGSYCIGGAGVHVGLSNSVSGVDYQLYNGASAVGSALAGTGVALDFGLQTTAGSYTVVATSTTTSCSANMSGSATVTVNTLPTTFTVTGGGSYCAGGSGVAIGLSGSSAGITYQLYNGASTVGAPVAGSGIAISFGLQTAAGTYTVTATNSTTTCAANMSGSATISTNALPTAYSVTGGGAYCSGGTGASIGLAGSDIGVSYQLYNGSLAVGSAVAGTGSSISFGTFMVATTYTVTAVNTTTGCSKAMTGSATISVNSLPASVAMTGGGTTCVSGPGVAVGLTGSQMGISYQLYNGASATGSPVTGTGTALNFGLQTAAGTYTAIATNLATGCTNSMTSTAIVSNYAPLTAFTVTGGGGYCSGGTGVTIGLSGSTIGVSYQLYRGATAVGSASAGTGSALSFGLQTTVGTYTVLATSTSTACSGNMTGSATVTINSLPTTYTITGGGSYCSGGAGVSIGLGNSDAGVNYQLYNGSTAVGVPVAGTGSSISFGLQTSAGIYTVKATDATTSCVNNMTGTATVSVNALPTAYTVTGGGAYCSGAGPHIYLSNSDAGINYQLYNGSSAVGSPVSGTGATLDMGAYSALGTYTVTATNATTGCTNSMTGSAAITGFALPTVYNVTGGGSYCTGGSGVAIGLSNSDFGVDYQLYNGGSAVGSPISGTSAALSFGLQTAAGTYTVVGTNTGSTCVNTMSGSAAVSISPLPTVYTITGGGTYCAGGTGVHVGLSNSDAGINYQLYLGSAAVGSPVAGTGTALDFGLQTTAGTYTAVATDASSLCTNNMSGSATIATTTAPAAYAVSGGGVFCAGGTGVVVGLSSSQAGISYQLFNGSSATGSPVTGTGSAISFGPQTAAGTYTIIATNTTTSCSSNMTGSATVIVNPLPVDYAFTGGTAYCSGGSGVTIGLAGSDLGVTYQLYATTTTLGTLAVGSPVAGTGSAISFGLQTTAALYSVVATNTTTGCTRTLSGSTNLIVYPLPAIMPVTGGGSYCSGGSGVAVTLPGSAVGINYQLYIGGVASGSPIAGIGTALSFGLQTTPGTYTVVATNPTTGCASNMSGSATVAIYPALATYSMTGGGSYCTGGTGVTVGLSGSSSGVSYQLYLGGSPLVGVSHSGTGSAISFGLQTSTGSYTVVATNNTTLCTANMSGTATVSINTLPTAYTVTGGGSYCTGGTGVAVGLASSDAFVNYQLKRGTTLVGAPVAGTGAAISFGLQTTAGTYTVVATNTTTGCVNNMTGSASVSINSLPAAFAVYGGGSYCTGAGPHVQLSGSVFGVGYQLYLSGVATGSPLSGTGGGLDFGPQSGAGTYTVVATNTSTGCVNNMSGSATVSIVSAPGVFAMTGGGSYCSGGTGVHVGLSGSGTGVSYQLYRGSTAVGAPVSGSGLTLDFGLQTTAGTYTVVATLTGYTCTSTMSGTATVSINSLPTVYSVTGGGTYCAGGSGLNVGLSGSQTGVNYQLYLGSTAIGSAVAGTGSALTFGAQASAGSYTVVATNATTSCTSNMSGSVSISINPQPGVFALTGGGSYCSGGSGVSIGLSGSQSGVHYQLYNGSSPVGSSVSGAGSGAAINFGTFTTAATYTATATYNSTGCSSNMNGSATIAINSLPTVYTVTGGGAYCSGGTGVHIGLSNSTVGVNYQLYNGTTASGTAVAGTGIALDFGLRTATGTYTVKATNAATGCSSNMSGSVSVSINSLPTIVSMTGGGAYCAGGTGVHVGLNASVVGVNYQLYLGGSPVGSPVAGIASVLDFGLQTAAGTYTAVATNATTGCVSNMSGSAVVSINPLPNVYSVTGGGSYCSGGMGVHVGLSGSNGGITYKLFLGGTPVTGGTLSGTGAPLDFGLETAAGTYTVSAMNAVTGCTSSMTGSASITVTPLPTAGTISGPTSVHDGATISLTSSVSGGTWSSSNTAIVTVGSGSGIVTGVSAGYANISYTVTTTCGTARTTVTIHDLGPTPPPQAGYTTGNTVICVGSFTKLTNSTPGGAWSSSDNNVASIDPTTGDVKGVSPGIAAITYTITTLKGNKQVLTPMVVNAEPDEVTVSAKGGTTILPGQQLTLTASVVNDAPVKRYQWLLNNHAVKGATSATFTGAGLANDDVVSCQVTSMCDNTVSGSAVVTVNADEVKPISIPNPDMRVTPNPNKGTFVIKGSTGSTADETETITVTDVLGQVIYSNSIVARSGAIDETVQLSSGTPNGMYLLTVRSSAGNRVFHIVIEQ